MPELPEVETIRRLLLPDVGGRRIERALVLGGHVTGGGSPAGFADSVRGMTVTALDRRGKYLVFALQAPARPPLRMIVHLRMTGRLAVVAAARRSDLPRRHTHVIFRLRDPSGGLSRLYFYDVRKFGRITLAAPAELARVLPSGRDPVIDGVDGPGLRSLFARRSAPLKPLLLRQDLLCGLGNIYADEALHRAGLHPRRQPASLRPREWDALAGAIRAVLAEALAFQGTTLFDYRRPDGEPGAFGRFLRVYGRAGQPCGTCGAVVAACRLSGRTAAFCPRCQRAPDAGPGRRSRSPAIAPL